MQIKLKGELSMADIRQALFEKLYEIEDEYAVRFSRGATLYINPSDGEGGQVEVRGPGGKKIRHLSSRGPYRAAADDLVP